MDDEKKPESHVRYIVTDKKTEHGVLLNNLLTGLLLAAALWVGNSLEEMKSTVAVLANNQLHNDARTENLEGRIERNDGRLDVLERLHNDYFRGAP